MKIQIRHTPTKEDVEETTLLEKKTYQVYKAVKYIFKKTYQILKIW